MIQLRSYDVAYQYDIDLMLNEIKSEFDIPILNPNKPISITLDEYCIAFKDEFLTGTVGISK